MDDSLIFQTPIEWFDWLSAEETKTVKAYLAKPATLIGSYHNEIATTHDYEGREILELLQNAADQARETDLLGCVVIELMPEGLVIANNGAAFSVGGVLSLENTYLSSKRHKRRQFIGSKGLGFRSVLNWTRTPIILSGALSLAYSQRVSQEKLEKLLAESSELAELVTEERGESNDLVIPVLPFPGYCRNGCIDTFVEEKAAQQILECCLRWRERGYTTAIGMPFENREFFDAARTQIKALRPEILLFVNHLDEVRFHIPEEDERVWRLEGDDAASMVVENKEPLAIWEVHRSQGEVPENQLDRDQKSPLTYELIVAVPEVETMDELRVSPLFSYFPTTITLPLPVVCHATLELDQNRNHVQQRRSNRYVFDRLAKFLAEVAEIRAARYPTGAKAGFRLLMEHDETYPSDLQREEFSERLMEAAALRAIVPTLGGRVVVARQAHSLGVTDNSWLPVSSFGDMVHVSSKKESKFFKELGVEELDTELLRQRLLAIEDLPLTQRADLIAGMIKHNVEVHTSALLIAPDAKPIPDDVSVFIAPKGGAVPTLPNWVTVWFLDDHLRLALMELLDVKDVRKLQVKLSSFGLLEYSFARLISRVVAEANQHKKDQPELTASIERELLSTAFTLYRAEGPSGNRPALPENTSLPLPTQAGSNIAAGDLYMGSGYGSQGNILQGLYGSWSLERLLVEPKLLGLPDTDVALPAFLEWLGVATWPRKKIINNPDRGYFTHVLNRMSYPARFGGDYIFNSRSDIEGAELNWAKTVDGLDEILQQANSVAITAWLALDGRVVEWSRKNSGHANLTALKQWDRKPRPYHGSLPGYVRWKLETTEWLLDKDRQHLRPKDCVLGERAIEALFPRPEKPDRDDLELYGISENDLVEGWRRCGVLTSLAELELDDIYARLLELPERQSDGKSARSLYSWLLKAAESALGEGGSVREQFFSKGRMWGHRGDEGSYFPVSELHHVDSEDLPETLLDRLKIVDLPNRVGADKVKRVFGVESLDRGAIKQKIKNLRLAENIDPEFQKAKPFFFKLRTSQTSQTQHLGTLKHLSLKMCSELCAVIEYDGDNFDFVLPVWGWLIDGDVLYIRSDPVERVDCLSDLLADAIGEAIASIFRIGDGGEFARMFLCKKKDRKALLRRMRGETADENMDRIIEEFGQQKEANKLGMLQEVGPIEEPESIDSNGTGAGVVVNENTTKEVLPDQSETDAPSKIPEGLSIEPVEHYPQAAPTRQKMRIQRKTSKRSSHTTTHRVTDGDFTERKIVEIEEAFQPPRYPLRVGQLSGSDAPGCDILSFDSTEQRERFRNGEDRDMGKVRRFIEVKGRKHEGAEIELRGNEKDAAVKYGDRYYLYRLFKSGENDYTLSILRNPLASEEALENSVYVHLNRAKKMEAYDVFGGKTPNEFGS